MPDEKYPFVIMAGGTTPEKIIDSGETEKEHAFIDIKGQPMLAWVLDAIRESGISSEILCFGNVDRLKSTFGLSDAQVHRDLGSMLDNFMTGMERFKDKPKVLVVTCDIPLLTPDSLKFIIGEAQKIQAEVYYPIVNVALLDEKFPGGKRTTLHLKEGTFTGGNVFVLDPDKILKNRDKVAVVIRDRKSPAKLIKLFGLPFIVKFALKKLDMKCLEDKATQILGARMRGIITPFPEVGFDVDKPGDLSLIRKIMGRA